LREIAWILAVDLRREGRSLAVVGGAVLMALGVVSACALAGWDHADASLASAAVWVAVAFVGVHAASGAYAPEQQSGALTALLCGPVRPLSLYVGKTLGILLFTGLGAATAVLAAGLLLHPGLLSAFPGRVLAIVALGSVGFSVVGGLFGPLLGLGGGRDALLALLLLPLGVPLVVTCARATQALLREPAALDAYRDSLGIALGLDGLFLAGALWLFEPLVRRNK
jgi:heme exporter protein B